MRKQVIKMVDTNTFTVIEDTDRKEKPFYIYKGGRYDRHLIHKTETMGQALSYLYALHIGIQY